MNPWVSSFPLLFYSSTNNAAWISSYTHCGVHFCECLMGKSLAMELLDKSVVFLILRDVVKSPALQKYPPIYISTNGDWEFPIYPLQKLVLSDNSKKPIFYRRSRLKTHGAKAKQEISLFTCVSKTFKNLTQLIT